MEDVFNIIALVFGLFLLVFRNSLARYAVDLRSSLWDDDYIARRQHFVRLYVRFNVIFGAVFVAYGLFALYMMFSR